MFNFAKKMIYIMCQKKWQLSQWIMSKSKHKQRTECTKYNIILILTT
jgi:hypothetical protein